MNKLSDFTIIYLDRTKLEGIDLLNDINGLIKECGDSLKLFGEKHPFLLKVRTVLKEELKSKNVI